jgi:DNA-binding transcriptional LysR family regulator
MPSSARAPTLDQLRIFLAAADAGSFVGAARRLRRPTSVVSYAIANMEDQLGVRLFDRQSTRKPQLTDAGTSILADARTIAHGVDGLLAKANGLLAGLEAEVALVVDAIVPMPVLVEALHAFQQTFPTVSMRLQVETLGAVAQAVRDGIASLGIIGPLELPGDTLTHQHVAEITMLPVAAASHPLALQGGSITARMLREHVQLVLTDRSALTQGQDFAVYSARTMRLTDIGSKHALLLAGAGWGGMPAAQIRSDLDAGRLVALPVDGWSNQPLRLEALWRPGHPPGPAGQWLLERLQAADWSA